MGLNQVDRLSNEGMSAKKGSVAKVPIHQLTLKRTGPTAHPRADLPFDEGLVQHIMKNGMRALTGEPWRFLVRDNGKGATDLWPELEVINGSRRENAGLEAERRLHESAAKMPPLAVDKNDPDGPGRLFVEVELFDGTDAELLLARLAANSEPGKLPDSIEVLATTVLQLTALGVDDAAEILKVMPIGTTKADVLALARWKSLTDEARQVLVGGNAPVYMLSQVLAVKREGQADMARKLLASGATTRLVAGRVAQKEKGAARTFHFTPRSLGSLANHVADAKVGSARDRAMLSAGLLLGSGRDIDSVGLPPDIVHVVKEFVATTRAKADKPPKEKTKK